MNNIQPFLTDLSRIIISLFVLLCSWGYVDREAFGASTPANAPSSNLVSALPTESIHITYAAYSGTGCPSGMANYVLSPERDKISVFFDDYRVTSGNSEFATDRKNCILVVGLTVPPGLSVALVAMDYRGYVFVPPGAYTELKSNYFFAGYPAILRFSHIWGNESNLVEEDFYLRDEMSTTSTVWSHCGKPTFIIAYTSITAVSNKYSEPAEIQIDTFDANAKLDYLLQWRLCR